MEVHQVLVGATSGDAITNMAFRLRGDLRRLGPSEIYAHHIDSSVSSEVHPLGELGRRCTEPAALVYHSSIGEPAVTRFLVDLDAPLVLCFHNMTPPELVLDSDPELAMLLAWGREELRLLRPLVRFSVADSSFNASQLNELGYECVTVLPLGAEPQRLLDVPNDPTAAAECATWPEPRILVVGQLLPHKSIEVVLQAYYVLTTFLELQASLIIAGRARASEYPKTLRGFIDRYGLYDAHMIGNVSDRVLATHFRAASLYVSASAHEGLGVPALEAMAFGIPVIARRAGAVPETVGSAALLLSVDDGPEVLAAVMARTLDDPQLRGRLIRAGVKQARSFDATLIHDQFLQLLQEHL